MATTEALTFSDAVTEQREFEYRSMHAGAIASIVLAVLSLMVFVAGRDTFEAYLMLAPIPLAGLAIGLRAISRIRKFPEQYTGGKLALAGVALSTFSLFGGLAVSGYVYATELPAGYERTSFADLRPNAADERGGKIVSPEVAALDGKKVFIKGYFRPDSSDYRINATRFLLVRDNNQCCFGDLSTVKYYDQVAVQLTGKLTVDYSPALFRLGGVLRIIPENAFTNAGPVFAIEADYAVQP